MRVLQVIRATVAVLCVTVFADVSAASSVPRERVVIETASGEVVFTVELARNAEERARGLMHREHLTPGTGMLFDFRTPQRVRMWMRNTLIPLDMLFVNAGGRIVHVEHQAAPHTLHPRGPDEPVLGVIEVPGGTARAAGIREGDLVRHPLFGTAGSR